MTTPAPRTGLQLRTLVSPEGRLELSLAEVPTPEPADDEVVVRVEAAPINPSDMGLLFAGADMSQAKASGTADRPVITADLSPAVMQAMASRIGDSLPAGNEGAGTVVWAGASPAAQALLGKVVALRPGGMYSQYRTVKVRDCLPLPDGTTPAEGASCFVNPLTALGMVETMRQEGHTALVHTAAASNLGQMLINLCREDNVPLVNIVRKQDQVDLLKSRGARYVCNSSAPSFIDDLTNAIAETGATIAFDATGGGPLAGQILTAMEAALVRNAKEYSRYGSTTHKQVYIYGGLDRRPTEFVRSFGLAWGIGGWLLTFFLQRIGPDAARKLQERVAAGIKTTFASSYTKEVSLAEMLSLEAIAVYGQQATGTKYLVRPHRG